VEWREGKIVPAPLVEWREGKIVPAPLVEWRRIEHQYR
jgi:hypothetical protein